MILRKSITKDFICEILLIVMKGVKNNLSERFAFN